MREAWKLASDTADPLSFIQTTTRIRKGFRLMAETGKLRDDPLWFKDAVFYEVYVRGFYDIADYYAILPEYGTLEDFRQFIDAAHARGIRVITDLVVNHTSDQHPWFKEASASPNSPKRDWYVWSDSPEKYKEARIIFTDT